MEKSADYLGHRERLRERYIADEGKSMADYELLELLLTGFIPRKDVKPISKRLIKRFGSLTGVLKARREDLKTVEGVGEIVSTYLKVVNTCGERSGWENLSEEKVSILSDWDNMVNYCRSTMGYLEIEELRLILLDARCQVIKEEIIQRGTVNRVAIHPREILKTVINTQALKVILVHNHPSGDVTPSRDDIAITKQINEALQNVGIGLVDHLIVSKNLVFSFRDRGLI